MYDYVIEDINLLPLVSQVDAPVLPDGTDCLVTGGMQSGSYVVVRGGWYLLGSLHPHRSYGSGHAQRRRLGIGDIGRNRAEAVFGTIRPHPSDDPNYKPPAFTWPTGPRSV